MKQKLGKPVKSDEKQQKVTFPYFIGRGSFGTEGGRADEPSERSLSTIQYSEPRAVARRSQIT